MIFLLISNGSTFFHSYLRNSTQMPSPQNIELNFGFIRKVQKSRIGLVLSWWYEPVWLLFGPACSMTPTTPKFEWEEWFGCSREHFQKHAVALGKTDFSHIDHIITVGQIWEDIAYLSHTLSTPAMKVVMLIWQLLQNLHHPRNVAAYSWNTNQKMAATKLKVAAARPVCLRLKTTPK